MDVNENGYCFVCGEDNPIGFKAAFTLDRETKSAASNLNFRREFQGWENVVHGGMLSTLLDEAAIYACRTCGERFVTVELNVVFRKPVAVDAPVAVTARVVRGKRKIFDVESQIEQDGDVCATARVRAFKLA